MDKKETNNEQETTNASKKPNTKYTATSFFSTKKERNEIIGLIKELNK